MFDPASKPPTRIPHQFPTELTREPRWQRGPGDGGAGARGRGDGAEQRLERAEQRGAAKTGAGRCHCAPIPLWPLVYSHRGHCAPCNAHPRRFPSKLSESGVNISERTLLKTSRRRCRSCCASCARGSAPSTPPTTRAERRLELSCQLSAVASWSGRGCRHELCTTEREQLCLSI